MCSLWKLLSVWVLGLIMNHLDIYSRIEIPWKLPEWVPHVSIYSWKHSSSLTMWLVCQVPGLSLFNLFACTRKLLWGHIIVCALGKYKPWCWKNLQIAPNLQKFGEKCENHIYIACLQFLHLECFQQNRTISICAFNRSFCILYCVSITKKHMLTFECKMIRHLTGEFVVLQGQFRLASLWYELLLVVKQPWLMNVFVCVKLVRRYMQDLACGWNGERNASLKPRV